GERLTVLLLNQERADRAVGTVADTCDHGLEFARNLDPDPSACLVLSDPHRAITNVPSLDLENVCGSLARQQGQVHGVLHRRVRELADLGEFLVGNVAIAPALLEAPDP